MRVFVSFDERYDRDLYDLFVEQSSRPGSSFEIVRDASSAMRTKGWSEHPRSSISAADEVIVLCGEHTDESLRVSAELEIAREEEKPYLLVWGRRDVMCTKPDSARPTDGMYSWTRNILEQQTAATLRAATPRVIPEAYKRRPDRAKVGTTPVAEARAEPASEERPSVPKQRDS